MVKPLEPSDFQVVKVGTHSVDLSWREPEDWRQSPPLLYQIKYTSHLDPGTPEQVSLQIRTTITGCLKANLQQVKAPKPPSHKEQSFNEVGEVFTLCQCMWKRNALVFNSNACLVLDGLLVSSGRHTFSMVCAQFQNCTSFFRKLLGLFLKQTVEETQKWH